MTDDITEELTEAEQMAKDMKDMKDLDDFQRKLCETPCAVIEEDGETTSFHRFDDGSVIVRIEKGDKVHFTIPKPKTLITGLFLALNQAGAIKRLQCIYQSDTD